MKNIVVLVSGGGTNLQALIDAEKSGIIKDGTTVFDHDYEPPLFSAMARRILENNGALVDDPYDQTRGAPKKFLQ